MKQEARTPETLLSVTVWLCTGLLLWPAARWLVERSFAETQLQHAFLILFFTGWILFRDRPEWRRLSFHFGPRSSACLAAAYAAAALALALRSPPLMLLALTLAVAAALLFVFGDPLSGAVLALVVPFGLFVQLVLAQPAFDWPLRIGAGRNAAWILDKIGRDAQLALVSVGDPKLLLASGGRLYEVAPECNGLGLMSGAFLLALLLVCARRWRWTDRALALLFALLAAYLANAIRITLIVLLAPRVGTNYHAMHETVGTAMMAACLALVWWMLRGLPEKPRPEQSRPPGEVTGPSVPGMGMNKSEKK